ncbi:hypothetical protein J1N35_010898 [Gossypium stocksii]|uniref:Pectinesterase inhibitor domain-containing protein n=1 Tax=Gossypium stocksii TaxID=47602 RepID=A0A9D4ACW8_9ROSI|nr:hypothetical protein J1N35_010898 [Gossypium stocksii]
MNQYVFLLLYVSCLFSFSVSAAPGPEPSFITSDTHVAKPVSIMPGNFHSGLQKVCSATDEPVDCIQLLSPLMTDRTAVDPISILRVGIEATNQKVKEALDKANIIMKDPSTTPEYGEILWTCVKNFEDIIDSDQKAMEAITKHNANHIIEELSADSASVSPCEDELEAANIQSPVRDIVKSIHKTISINLAIAAVQVHF